MTIHANKALSAVKKLIFQILNVFLFINCILNYSYSAQVRFEKCLDELKKKSSEYSDIPWVINTMGFTEGLGIHLMKKSVEMFRPTTIVEIESRYFMVVQKGNVRQILTSLPL